MLQSIVSYVVPAEVQLTKSPEISQHCAQVHAGLSCHSAALQPERFQSAVFMAQPLCELTDSIVADAVVPQVQFSQVRPFCA